MVRWLVVAALVVSLGICAIADLRAQKKYRLTREQIASRHTELQKLADIDAQVQAFQKQKDALQRRIGIINSLQASQPRSGH